MALLRLPVTWMMSGWIEVEADSVADAVVLFNPTKHNLPEGAYVGDSFALFTNDLDAIAAIQPREGSKS